MARWRNPFSGRPLTAAVAAVCTTLVVAPGTVWAIDTFSNVAIEDPGTGTKAHVDSGHHLLVGDGSGSLTVDGKAVQTLPSTQKSPFRGEAFLNDFNNVGFQTITDPSKATVALRHLSLSSRVANSDPWEMFLYEAEGSTQSECAANLVGDTYARIAARAVEPGQSSTDDFTTPLVLKPLHTGASWCLVAGAGPRSSTATNTQLVLDYSGFVVSGSFTPSTTAPTRSPRRSPANP